MLVDAVKTFLNPKAFYPVVYLFTSFQLLAVVVFIPIVLILSHNDGPERIVCDFQLSCLEICNTLVRRSCFTRYQIDYNYGVPFYAFVIPSISFPILVAFAYSYCVRKEVRTCCIYKRRNEIEENGPEQQDYNKIDKYYYIHLLIRFLFGILFLILQNAVLFANGFKSEFKCTLPLTTMCQTAKNAGAMLNSTFPCTNSTAIQEGVCSSAILGLNILFLLVLLVEMVLLCRKNQRFRRLWQVMSRSDRCKLKSLISVIVTFLLLLAIAPLIVHKEILHSE